MNFRSEEGMDPKEGMLNEHLAMQVAARCVDRGGQLAAHVAGRM